jgi:hypothetical protein
VDADQVPEPTSVREPEATPAPAPASRRRLILRGALVVVVLAIVAMWIYVFSGGGRDITKLESPTFGRHAEPVCAATLEQLRAIPRTGDTPAKLADLVGQATADLRTMVDRLAAAAPQSGPDAARVKSWLTEWRRYLADRDDWVKATRAKNRVEAFAETQSAGAPISLGIDAFARANAMSSCSTPSDIS